MAIATFDSRSLAANLLQLGAGEFFAKLLAVLAFTYLGRTLGPEGYGRLEFAFAVVVFFNFPVDFGLGTYGAREIAKDRSRAAALASDVSLLRLALTVLSYATLLLFAAAFGGDPQTKVLIACLGLSLFAAPALLQWVFQGLDRMRWVAWASALRQTVFAAGTFALVRSRESLVWVAAAECAAAAAAALLSLILFRREVQRIPRPGPFQFARLWRHFKSAVPIGLSDLGWALMWYSPIVILGAMTAGPTVGWFGAAHRSLLSLHTFVNLYFFNLLPSMSRCAASSPELGRLLERSLGITAWAGAGIAVVGILVSRRLLTMLYGAEYAGGDRILGILILVIPVALVSGHFRLGLVAFGRSGQLLYATLAAAGVCCALCIVLVPRFGAEGTAMALLAGNVVHLVLTYLLFREHVMPVPVVSAAVWPFRRLLGGIREAAAR